jgi:hypothetical protein
VTTVPRTLLDLASALNQREVERAVNEAEVQRRTDPLSLPALLDRYPRRRGTTAIREILAQARVGATVTRSELEERFLRFLADWGLPRPELNASIAVRTGFVEADCLWRGSRLIAGVGRQSGPRDGRGVRARSGPRPGLGAEGWRVIRITWRQLSEEARGLADDLGSMLEVAVNGR